MGEVLVGELVKSEIARITDPKLVATIRPLLVSPHMEFREWDYGKIGEKYPCWIVLEHLPSNTVIAYCDQGFGPDYPWGLLFMSGPYMSMGMDSQWFISLEDAVRESFVWDGENPPGYEVQ